MGHGFRTDEKGWTFDSLVRAVRRVCGGPHRLLGVAERVRVLSILASLPREAEPQKPVILHNHFFHAPSQRCPSCRSEAIAISICDLLARKREREEVFIDAA